MYCEIVYEVGVIVAEMYYDTVGLAIISSSINDVIVVVIFMGSGVGGGIDVCCFILTFVIYIYICFCIMNVLW